MWIRTQAGNMINLDFAERVVIRCDREIEHEKNPYAVTVYTNGGRAEDIAYFSTPDGAELLMDGLCEKVGASKKRGDHR